MQKWSNKMHVFIFYLLMLLVQQNKVSGNNTRIIGGNTAAPELGLFHASLQNLTGHHVCGGAVVSPWHVVTAGHCVKGVRPRFIKIVVGTTHLDEGGKKYDTFSINLYNDFNFSSKVNDIALLTIKGQFDLSYVQIIDFDENELVDEDLVILTGFGAREINGESSRELYALCLPVFNQDICKFAMRYSRDVTDNMFCTFTRIGQGTCHGDSGSPIIRNGKLVGLVSWGIPCAVGFPDVHTRITPYIGWIKNVIRNNSCKLKKILTHHVPYPAKLITYSAK